MGEAGAGTHGHDLLGPKGPFYADAVHDSTFGDRHILGVGRPRVEPQFEGHAPLTKVDGRRVEIVDDEADMIDRAFHGRPGAPTDYAPTHRPSARQQYGARLTATCASTPVA